MEEIRVGPSASGCCTKCATTVIWKDNLELVLGKCPTSDNTKKYAKTWPYK